MLVGRCVAIGEGTLAGDARRGRSVGGEPGRKAQAPATMIRQDSRLNRGRSASTVSPGGEHQRRMAGDYTESDEAPLVRKAQSSVVIETTGETFYNRACFSAEKGGFLHARQGYERGTRGS